jgi:flagellar hook-basal body complex protein FliE
MSTISSIPSSLAAMPTPLTDRVQPNQLYNAGSANGLQSGQPAGEGFGKMLDGLVSTVDAKQVQADSLTKKVLLGDTDQLHQSVIAMQEASVSLSLMVQVRNKLVDSYQELMRMQV